MTSCLGRRNVCGALLVALLVSCQRTASPVRTRFPSAEIRIGGQSLTVEVACTDEARYQGYRFRAEAPPGTGMLFIFPEKRYLSFTMANTTIPLSIAFIDEAGVIKQISHMKPLDHRNLTRSTFCVPNALEVSQGWFEAHGISTGDRVEGIAAIRKAYPPAGEEESES